MSVSELFSRVIDLETRLGLESDGQAYSERILSLLDALDVPVEEEVHGVSPELDAGALENHISQLKDIVGHYSSEATGKLDGTMEEIMGRIASQMESAE
jgi:hypothetical protein